MRNFRAHVFARRTSPVTVDNSTIPRNKRQSDKFANSRSYSNVDICMFSPQNSNINLSITFNGTAFVDLTSKANTTRVNACSTSHAISLNAFGQLINTHMANSAFSSTTNTAAASIRRCTAARTARRICIASPFEQRSASDEDGAIVKATASSTAFSLRSAMPKDGRFLSKSHITLAASKSAAPIAGTVTNDFVAETWTLDPSG
ncbi:hypothetical protein M513_00335 [Trichuris suis]|uniref:Uncharacterized protein n=1 Tax=Trichuris suis TaxID=68888 RepID=A0A085MN46_9BILA|nr:hypothetical protein M513_00335 [Trichuris suis]